METVFNRSTNTGDIVVRLPRASSLFKKYKIDFCCGGNRPLGEVLSEKSLDENLILGELQQLYETAVSDKEDQNWMGKSYHELIDHIVNTHHGYLYNVLPELEVYTTKILAVHGKTHPELSRLHYLFSSLKLELEHHMKMEEETIFAKIKDYEDSPNPKLLAEIIKLNKLLEEDHQNAGSILSDMRELTDDYQLPDGACTTYKLTYLKLEELESDLFQHIHLENNILFPRLTAGL